MLTNQVQGIRTSYAAGGTRTLKAAVKVRYASLQRILKFHLFQVLNWTFAGKLSCLSFLLVSYEYSLQRFKVSAVFLTMQLVSGIPMNTSMTSLASPQAQQASPPAPAAAPPPLSCSSASQMLSRAEGWALGTACSTSSCTDLWVIINPVQIGVWQ